MPEIKHQFTGGKMNKDLDERLVPNGEYRDAMNIQVSTSEGSDVGTAQNILGNSLVPGQGFIGDNAVCVGSIADEKHDKIYYFIAEEAQELLNDTDLVDSTEWYSSAAITEDYNGKGVLLTSSGGAASTPNYPSFQASNFDLVHGNTYELNVEFSDVDNGGTLPSKFFMVGRNGGDSNYRPYYDDNQHNAQVTSGGKYTNIFTFNQVLNNNLQQMSFFVEMVNGGTFEKTIRLESVSLKERSNSIIEYDSKSNTVTPVLVDAQGDVLKFRSNNIITGINIIDGLLFWTDNENEPKKINIQRSIEGTHSGGNTHTNFINHKTGLSTPIKEEHITVIKRGPTSQLGLGFLNPLDRDAKTLAGVVTTTALNSTSSFIQNVTQATNPVDFSGIALNDTVRLEIPTDIDGNSSFALEWQVGDTVVFKEFTGGTAPVVPLSTWVAKGVIQDWSGNNFQDADSSVVKNGQFDYSVGNNLYNVPSWNFNHAMGSLAEQTNLQVFGWRWEGTEQAMIFNTPDFLGSPMAWAKLWQSPTSHNFKVGDSYKLTYTLSDRPAGGLPNSANVGALLGRVNARILINGDRYDFGYKDTTGTHTQTIVLDSTSYNGSSSSSWSNHFYFQTDGNQRCRGMIDNVSLEWIEAPNAQVEVKINSIDSNPPTPASINSSSLDYAVDKYVEAGSLFKDKLVRFSYRYKYEDGEYSTFAPFSGVAFSPGNFNYNPKNGYNLGMVNQLQYLELSGFTASDMSDGVVAVDLLAKVEDSPIIYLVDTIQPTDTAPLSESDNAWNLNKYIIKSDTVKGALPSNQLLRAWDNVPKQALAQEITGNRLVYGNYKQGYNLLNASGSKFTPEFGVNIEEGDREVTSKRSIKSLRDYQLGVVFLDEQGRETPVISNQTGSFHINKDQANKSNVIEATFKNQDYPSDARYFKFFIKETAGEYYNVAMGRHYVDDDGSVWLSFPSSDRNKVSEDTFLTLKKGVDSNNLVEEAAKYKVLSIKNEAPDFIKTSRLLVEEKKHNVAATTTDLFGSDLTNAPTEGKDSFKISYLPFIDSSGNNLHETADGDLYVEFSIDGTNKTSNRYRVSKLSSDIGIDSIAASAAVYSFKLKGVLGDDVNFITDDISGNNATKILENTVISIYKYIDDAKDTFEGRFFVKIIADDVFSNKIKVTTAGTKKYSVVNSQKLYFMNSDFASLNTATKGHSSNSTGLTNGAYNTELTTTPGMDYINYQAQLETNAHHSFTTLTDLTESHRDFSKFAVFFRNYRYSNSSYTLDDENQAANDAGKYKFGAEADTDWETEFKDYTSSGDADWDGGWTTTGTYPTPKKTKIADARQPDDEVWFIDNGPFLSHRGTNNSLHWKYIGGVSSPAGGTAAATGKSYSYKSGITTQADEWFMDIGQGGIYQTGISHASSNFFGNDNVNYQDANTQDIISKHNPGTQFRFKEDPTETVYTIQPSTSYQRVVRYSANYNYANSTLLNEHEIPRLSPNFTNNRRLKIEPKLEWNPASGTLGPITGGFNISADIVATGTKFANTTSNIEDFYIVLDTNIGVDPVYGNIPITPGLIVTNYGSNSLGGASTPYLIVKDVVEDGVKYEVYLCGYSKLLEVGDTIQPSNSDTIVFQQPQMNGYTENSTNRINTNAAGFSITKPGLKAVGYSVEFLTEVPGDQSMPDNPAIFETEPKTEGGGSIYYEASGANAVTLSEKTIDLVLPVGSIITSDLNDPGVTQTGTDSYIPADTVIASHVGPNTVILSQAVPVEVYDSNQSGAQTFPGVAPGKNYRIIKPNGSSSFVTIESITQTAAEVTAKTTVEISFKTSLLNQKHYLNWHNCYSFGNGVESNRIKDLFNEQYISNGVKASATLDEDFGEEHRKYGLIFSGIYNSNSSTNNLNQFIQAEAITKDVNPIYGSIQKLHSRDSDLLTFCEDKVLKILANKDAIYNADGNPQLTANQNVLGQTIPFSGEFGISTNPESFASESYRVYFADRVRGAILRLSKDGLTPISDHGMKVWFRDNLSLGTTNLLGENSLSAVGNWNIPQPVDGSGGGNSFVEDGVATLGYFNDSVHDARYGRPAYLKMENVLEIGKKYRLQFDVIEHGGLTRENGSRSSITIDNSPAPGIWSGVSGMGNSRYDGAHVNVEWTASRTDLSLLQYQVNYRHDVDLNNDGDTEDSGEQNLTGYYDPGNGSGVQSIQSYVNALRVAAGLPDLFGPELIQDPNFDEAPTLWVTLDDGNYNPAIFTAGQCELTGFNRINTANDILLPSTDYVLEYEVTANSNPGYLGYWDGANFWIHGSSSSTIGTHAFSFTTGTTFTSSLGTNFYLRHQGILDSTDSITLGSVSLRVDGSDNIPDNNDYGWQSYLYGGTVTIKNLLLEEVKEDLKIVGSHDDRQNEYNVTIHGANSSTVSFKEDVRGWVSFKSFIPENGISCANDYYTMLDGKLWQHHNPGANRNTFYNAFSNSSINVLLNDGPGSVKSFHSLDYEGSQSKIDLNAGDNEYYNLTAKDGWYVSHIETNKQKGSLSEFIEKEGKWFNYIKGVGSDISMDTDFGAFDIQGVGMLANISSNTLNFDGAVNSSLQIGDTIYQRQPIYDSGFTILNHNDITKCGVVTSVTSNTITVGTMEAVPLVGDFILFAKNNAINTSSLLGYYADVKLENNSKVKAEIFSIGAEVTESSK